MGVVQPLVCRNPGLVANLVDKIAISRGDGRFSGHHFCSKMQKKQYITSVKKNILSLGSSCSTVELHPQRTENSRNYL